MNRPYRIVFPRVLTELCSIGRARSASSRRIEIVNATECLSDYFSQMSSGRDYQIQIHQMWNVAAPHRLSWDSLRLAKKLAAQGLHYGKLEKLVEQDIPGLDQIPPAADFIETDDYDDQLAQIMAWLDAWPGIGTANAAKLLHQKRPGLVPILDQLARRSMCIPVVPGTDAAAHHQLLKLVRDFLDTENNRSSIIQTASWFNAQGLPAEARPLSPIRALDIAAWMVGRMPSAIEAQPSWIRH